MRKKEFAQATLVALQVVLACVKAHALEIVLDHVLVVANPHAETTVLVAVHHHAEHLANKHAVAVHHHAEHLVTRGVLLDVLAVVQAVVLFFVKAHVRDSLNTIQRNRRTNDYCNY